MSDWSEHYLRAKTALSRAEQELRHDRVGEGYQAFEEVIEEIRQAQLALMAPVTFRVRV